MSRLELTLRSWMARVSGRNPLVRPVDRVEVVVGVAVVMLIWCAIPVAAAIGTSVRETRAEVYALDASHRHRVSATAVADSTTVIGPNSVVFQVLAQWNADGGHRIRRVETPEIVKKGDRIPIWVDDTGGLARAPRTSGQAAFEAVGTAVLTWLGVTLVLAGGYFMMLRRLNGVRYAAWEREFATLDDDGGRRDRSA